MGVMVVVVVNVSVTCTVLVLMVVLVAHGDIVAERVGRICERSEDEDGIRLGLVIVIYVVIVLVGVHVSIVASGIGGVAALCSCVLAAAPFIKLVEGIVGENGMR